MEVQGTNGLYDNVFKFTKNMSSGTVQVPGPIPLCPFMVYSHCMGTGL